jgi:hypothetical protein
MPLAFTGLQLPFRISGSPMYPEQLYRMLMIVDELNSDFNLLPHPFFKFAPITSLNPSKISREWLPSSPKEEHGFFRHPHLIAMRHIEKTC